MKGFRSHHPPSLDFSWRNVRKLANVRIACTLECDGPRIGRIPGHSFGPPDRGALALALLCFTRRSTVFGADEWRSNRLRPWRPPQQFAHGQCVFFSLASCGAGAFLTFLRGKPDHTAAERRSISAFQNCFGDQRNSGVAEHRQVISTGRPDTLFMWGLQLGGDYTAS